MSGPITSLATLGILRREMGNRVLCYYLMGIISTSLLLGLLADGILSEFGIQVPAQIGAVQKVLPLWLEWSALILLILVALCPFRRMLSRMAPVLLKSLEKRQESLTNHLVFLNASKSDRLRWFLQTLHYQKIPPGPPSGDYGRGFSDR